MPGKRVQFDEATWAAVDLLAREHSQTFQELAEEAFQDLLAKYDRSVDLKSQLLKSIRQADKENDSNQSLQESPSRSARKNKSSPGRR